MVELELGLGWDMVYMVEVRIGLRLVRVRVGIRLVMVRVSVRVV